MAGTSLAQDISSLSDTMKVASCGEKDTLRLQWVGTYCNLTANHCIDLCRLAGLQPAAIICEIVREEDGLMARRDDCVAFAKKYGLKIITIESLIEYLQSRSYHNGNI